MRTRPSAVPVVLAAGVLLLSACGGDSPLEGSTGPEVAELAADALEEAGSVQVSGEITTDGESGEIDLWLTGDDAEGTITFSGSDVEIISVGGDLYMKADPEFWGSFGMPGEVAAEVEDRWVAVPGDAAADFASFTLGSIADGLRETDDVEDEPREDERDGDPVVVVEQADGTRLVVADDDPPYPLELSRGGDSEGTLTFSDHGDDREISAPEDALDPETLVGG